MILIKKNKNIHFPQSQNLLQSSTVLAWTDICINGIEIRVHNPTPVFMLIWFLTNVSDNLFNGEWSVSWKNGAETTEYPHTNKWSWVPISNTKINLKWIIDINIRAKSIKLWENIRVNLSDLISQWCLRYNNISTSNKKKIDK